jgi:hypothetical protein
MAYSRDDDTTIYTAVDYVRGGRQQFGNSLWGDWDYLGITEFPQVVGHTTVKLPQIRFLLPVGKPITYNLHPGHEAVRTALSYSDETRRWKLPQIFNLNVDTDSRDFAILHDGKELELI